MRIYLILLAAVGILAIAASWNFATVLSVVMTLSESPFVGAAFGGTRWVLLLVVLALLVIVAMARRGRRLAGDDEDIWQSPDTSTSKQQSGSE